MLIFPDPSIQNFKLQFLRILSVIDSNAGICIQKNLISVRTLNIIRYGSGICHGYYIAIAWQTFYHN